MKCYYIRIIIYVYLRGEMEINWMIVFRKIIVFSVCFVYEFELLKCIYINKGNFLMNLNLKFYGFYFVL